MAEDNSGDLASEIVETNAPVGTPIAKKTRAPRQPKTVVAPALASSEAVISPAPVAVVAKPAGSGRGRKAKAVEPVIETPAKAKRAATRVKKAVESAARSETAPVAAFDDLQDLIKLEEENKRLRQLLSEKLRDENAELRKRLGHR